MSIIDIMSKNCLENQRGNEKDCVLNPKVMVALQNSFPYTNFQCWIEGIGVATEQHKVLIDQECQDYTL